MGNFVGSIKKGMIEGAMSYSGRFRYHAEFGKGLTISRLGVEVYEFDGTPGGTFPINLYTGKDNSIVIALQQARQSKRLSLQTPAGGRILSTEEKLAESSEIMRELFNLKSLNKSFFLSFAVQKNSNGKKIEMLLLQDKAATFVDFKAKWANIRYNFALSSPEVKAVSIDR